METLPNFFETWLGLGLDPQDLLFRQMALRALVLFAAALVMLRLAHKRFFARRNAIDVLLTFILASTLSRAINGSAAFFPTIAVGFILVFAHRCFAFLGSRWHAFGQLTKGTSATLIEHGQLHEHTLRAHALSRHDLEEDLRINGIAEPAHAERAVLERNGEVSVVPAWRIQTLKVEAGVQTIRIEVR